MEKFLQDSDVLSRRAVLSGVTFFGASALFAACSQQASIRASASASSIAAKRCTGGASNSPAC